MAEVNWPAARRDAPCPRTRSRLRSSWASTRPGRIGGTVAEWFVGQAEQRDDMVLDVIDLVDVELPAILPAGQDEVVDVYVRRIDEADAFVVITPEYNHGYPASLKQAIDVAGSEWNAKPIAFVSYGGMAGGMRAVEQLRQVFAELHAATVRDTVGFHGVHGLFDATGQPKDPEGCNAVAKTMLDRLNWWGHALRDARAKRPYGA